MDYKQAIIVRTDLEMGRGKIAAQSAHACLMAYKRADADEAQEWEESGSKKITLKVASERELLEIFTQAKAAKLPCALVKDAGHTQVEPGTPTAVAIGPAAEGEIDRITSRLKLL